MAEVGSIPLPPEICAKCSEGFEAKDWRRKELQQKVGNNLYHKKCFKLLDTLWCVTCQRWLIYDSYLFHSGKGHTIAVRETDF
jgi:hypothetical protein